MEIVKLSANPRRFRGIRGSQQIGCSVAGTGGEEWKWKVSPAVIIRRLSRLVTCETNDTISLNREQNESDALKMSVDPLNKWE